MWENTQNPKVFWAVDFVFLCFYCVELVLKLLVYGRYFPTNSHRAWNWMEFLLVVLSLAEQVTLLGAGTAQVWETDEKAPRLMYLRILRVLKVVKVLRLLRTFQYFRDLRVMVVMVIGSVVSLFWCIVMILCTLYFWSILIMQLLLLNLEVALDFDAESEEGDKIKSMFSTIWRTSITLFQATTGGMDWADIYTVISPHGTLITLLSLSYIIFFVVVAWNIITSTFVQKALSLAKPEREDLMFNMLSERAEVAQELKQLFHKLDKDDDGRISMEELRNLDQDVELRNWLETRSIRIRELSQFCDLLGSVDPGQASSLDIQTLVNACIHMKGDASGVDMQYLNFEIQRLGRMMYRINEHLGENAEKTADGDEGSANLELTSI